QDAHPKTRRPTRHRLADSSPSDDAQGGTAYVASKHQFGCPRPPLAGAHEMIAFDYAPRYGHHQGESEISGRFREDAGCMTHRYSGVGCGFQVNVVDPHG